MAQLTKGARALIDLMTEHLAAIRHYASELDLETIKMDPVLVADVFADIDKEAVVLLRQIVEDLEPMLQRQAAKVEEATLAELVERVAALEQALHTPDRNPIPFRRRMRGKE